MDKYSGQRANIIGAGEVGRAVTVEMDKDTVHAANSLYWNTKGNDGVLGAISLPYYGSFISEEKCRLLGDPAGKKVLEIGCGNGRSLQYVGERGAAELWGMDLSKEQVEKAGKHLAECGLEAKLICAPMEEECGIPSDYFDIVFSVYAVGWATDLAGTFCRIASYLKQGGTFLFSWSHPIHKCVAAEGETFVFKKNYCDESWYSVSMDGGELSLSDRMLSTYVNALATAGFVIERMIEESDEELLAAKDGNDAFAQKAKMLPVTFVIRARKL